MWLEWIHKENAVPVPTNLVLVLALVPVLVRVLSELLVNSQELRKSYEGAGERQDSDSERSDSKVQQSDDDQDKSCCSFCICLENICKKSPPSTTEERKKVMANLVVKYLMERYPEKFPLSEIIKAQSDDYGSGQRSGQT
nr:uncharacterized protein LOC131798127 isoform X2 [Pocillopora verrucosa]